MDMRFDIKLKRLAALVKRGLLTFGGSREIFRRRVMGLEFFVDYNLRFSKFDRDFPVILQLARNKKCILDVGANYGLVSILVALENLDAQVFAFEASETAVRVINQNVALNGLSNRVKAINTVVADCSGRTAVFYGDGSSGGASLTKGRLGHTLGIEKSTLSLDDYVTASSLRPDFIKMDIEGAESIAIKGMRDIMTSFRPDVFVELHEFGRKKLYENAKDILDFVASLNYCMVYLRTGRPVADTEVMMDRGRCHILLQPSEKYSKSTFETLDLSGL